MTSRNFKFARVKWSAVAHDHLEPALKADPTAGVEWLQNEVQAERMLLIGVYQGARRVGSVVCRIDVLSDKVLVIVAVGGKADGGNMYSALLPYWTPIAEHWGCRFIQAHTARRGAVKFLERDGFQEAERVFLKRVA